MSGMDIIARIHNSSAEKHGDKHTLPSAQVRHIGSFKKVAECVVRQDSSIKGLGSSPNRLPSADEIIEVIDHLIPHFLFEVRVISSMIERNAGIQLRGIRGSLPPTRCLRHQQAPRMGAARGW
jgi:hypothetical protein